MNTTIADLNIGEKALIQEIAFDHIPLALLEMGCLPGIDVELLQIAPFNDPLYIRVNGSYLTIRRETAEKIVVIKL